MKLTITTIFLAVTAFTNIAIADEYVHGYMRKNGTYVEPYVRTTSNNSVYDNYSTKGNSNPYTGQQGYVNPYNNPQGIIGSQNTHVYNPYRR